jgi:NAD(P)-dependent dehydrogenase (short-subunit alcohol dehydrogenase family)
MGNELEGRAAIVTGGRRGIGRAVALALAGAGADVLVCDIVADDGGLDGVAKEIRQAGRSALAVKADVSRASEVEEMASRAVSAFGRVDILANCAGTWRPGPTLLECGEDDWDSVIDVNPKGTFLCCRAVGRLMAGRKSGSIVNLSSQVGINPGVRGGAYSVSKAGIIMLTRQLALELAGDGIRVNAIAPGIVRTDFNRSLWEAPEDGERLAKAVPLGRLAEPEDIGRAALFLASDASSYITGAVLTVDGGWRV